MEKTPKYILNLEKQTQTSNIIIELKSSKGEMTNTTNLIIGKIISHCTNLFKTENISTHKIFTNVDNIEVPKLNEEDKEMLDKFPYLNECKNGVL